MTRVMVVDDEIDTLNLLRTILELSGYDTVATLHSIEALSLAQANPPDVILLDIMMPQLDGFTLCKMMRLHPATVNLPIVFITAYSANDLEAKRKEAGGDLVVPKPISMQKLTEAVQQALALRGAGAVAKLAPDTAPPPPLRMPGTSPLDPNKVKPPTPPAPPVPPTPNAASLAKTGALNPNRAPAPPVDPSSLAVTSPLNPNRVKEPPPAAPVAPTPAAPPTPTPAPTQSTIDDEPSIHIGSGPATATPPKPDPAPAQQDAPKPSDEIKSDGDKNAPPSTPPAQGGNAK